MKRIFLTIVAVLGVLAISSCGKNDDNPKKNDNINNGGGNNTIPNTEEKQTIPSSYYVVSPDGKTLMQWFNTEATSIDMQNDKVLSKVTRITAFFGDCKKLSSIVLPESLESLKGYTFSHCESLTSITIPKQITEIKEYTFLNCKSLASIELSSNTTSIGEGAFLGAGLTSITIPNSVTSIGRFAFLNCERLENVALPTNIEKLENSIFGGCISLSSITIPNRVKTIEDSAFYNTGLTSVIIPEGVQKIGKNAFGSCKKLITATIPKGVRNDKEILGAIFRDCEAFETLYLGSFLPNDEDSVKKVVLMDGITYIPTEAFYDWESLESISIPKGVINIGESAFEGCKSLASISIPKGVTNIGKDAFQRCISLKTVTIPEGVKRIGAGAFNNCENLVTATIPKGVNNEKETFGSIFYGCKNFQTLYLNSFLPNNEGNVREVVLPEDITYIPKEAFYLWYSLTTISIPRRVNRIGENAFQGCNKLTSITLEAETPPVLEKESLPYIIQDIYVPKRSLQAYKESASWEKYANKIKARL